ncbi:MAG TPA: hypothetical protein VFO85_16030 [Vicinamibacteria bacterium]|nr:hypothetical protein [Vicinamibacteria bacterium]
MVSQREMERIFEVTDRLGIHRESVVVPLGARRPGRVRRRPDGKVELVADAEDFDGWVAGLESELRALLG